MGKRKYSRSFEIALSAISCAVAVIFLLLGFWSNVLLATGYLLAIIALMVPLSKQFFRGGFLAYVGTVILAVVMGLAMEFWSLVPFIMFFGIHPLVNALQIRFRVNRWLAFLIKAVWFDFALWVAYVLVFGGVIGGEQSGLAIYEFINKYIYYIIFIGGTLFFIVYDYLIFKSQIAVNAIVYRIRK